jgi:hypothetical protein
MQRGHGWGEGPSGDATAENIFAPSQACDQGCVMTIGDDDVSVHEPAGSDIVGARKPGHIDATD